MLQGASAAPTPATPSVSSAGPQSASAPDYSAQWAEYYRSIGKTKEAEAIETQIRAKSSGGGGAPNPAPSQQPQYGTPGQTQYPGQPGYQPVSQPYYPQQVEIVIYEIDLFFFSHRVVIQGTSRRESLFEKW